MQKITNEGGDFNCVDYRGRAPIHIASINGNLDAASFLVKQNVNLDLIDNAGKSALLYACTNRHELIVDLLVENGATVIDNPTKLAQDLC